MKGPRPEPVQGETSAPPPVRPNGRSGPTHPPPPPTPEARIERDLARRLRAFERAVGRVRLRPDDEACHDLRVASRRLGAALRVWRALLDPRARRTARRRLRKLRREWGPVRELEVHVALLAGLEASLEPETRSVVDALRARLAARLERRSRRAARALTVGRVARVLRSLNRSWRRLGVKYSGLGEPLADAREQVGFLSLALGPRLRTALQAGDDASLHEVRILLKKTRYGLECLKPVLGGSPRLARLHDLQRSLGEVNDWATLARRGAKHAERLSIQGRTAALDPLLKRLAAERARSLEETRVLAMGLADTAMPQTERGSDRPPGRAQR